MVRFDGVTVTVCVFESSDESGLTGVTSSEGDDATVGRVEDGATNTSLKVTVSVFVLTGTELELITSGLGTTSVVV